MKIVLGIFLFLCFSLVGFGQEDTLTKEYRGLPVKKEALVKVLKSKKYSENELIEIVSKNGVDFVVTPALEAELKTAGAHFDLIKTIKQNYYLPLGVVNGKVLYLAQPPYPAAAKAVGASGDVTVAVLISTEGSVVSATAISGHPFLRVGAEMAARQSKFSPTLVSGKKVQVSGLIVYTFAAK